MSFHEDEIARELAETDDEFRRLFEKHQTYKKQIASLKKRKYLGAAESLEVNRLKKLKLQGKDEMTRRIQKFRARA